MYARSGTKIILLSYYCDSGAHDQPSLQGTMIHLENSQQNNTKQNQQREKARGVKPRGIQVQASLSQWRHTGQAYFLQG